MEVSRTPASTSSETSSGGSDHQLLFLLWRIRTEPYRDRRQDRDLLMGTDMLSKRNTFHRVHPHKLRPPQVQFRLWPYRQLSVQVTGTKSVHSNQTPLAIRRSQHDGEYCCRRLHHHRSLDGQSLKMDSGHLSPGCLATSGFAFLL